MKPVDPTRVLIVEDEVKLADALKVNLERRGYTIACCGSVEEAIPLLDKFMPHLLLTDGALPGAQGLSLAGYLRQSAKHKAVKIIAMSGDPSQKQLIRVMKDQIHGFLAKPFKTEELVEMLERLLPPPPTT
jgi:DNA-binding response OmpR family regulator